MEEKREKISEEIIVKNFSNMRKETLTQVQEMQSPIEDKPKDDYIETHTHQIDKN